MTGRDVEQDGVALIASERRRQVEEEGYTAEHDANLLSGDLLMAAIAYAIESNGRDLLEPDQAYRDWWPWSREAWKPTGERVRDLVKAGALIAAAIDAELRSRVVAS